MRLLLLATTVLGVSFSLAWASVKIPMQKRTMTEPIGNRTLKVLNTAAGTSQNIALSNYYNLMYTGQVSFGTNNQTFNLVFDTGSADLWVMSTEAPASLRASTTNAMFYDKSSSGSFELLGIDWGVTYGSGNVAGQTSRETVTLGGLIAVKQTFGLASDWSDDFNNPQFPTEGILGMAFQEAANTQAPTLIDSLYRQGGIESRKFSFYLDPTPTGQTSVLVLGEPDQSLFIGNLSYVPVMDDNYGMWFTRMLDVQVNGQSVADVCPNPGCTALIDTGTSFILIPADLFVSIIRPLIANRKDCGIVSQRGSYYATCSKATPEGLGDLSINLGNKVLTIKGEQYMLYNGQLGFASLSQGLRGNYGPFFILGDTFMKNVYTVFDMDNRQMGFAGAVPGNVTFPVDNGMRILTIIGVAVLSLLAVIIVVFGIRACLRKNKSGHQYRTLPR